MQEEITKITEDGRKKVNELLKINEDLEQDKDTEISRLRNILEDGGARGDTTLGKFNFFKRLSRINFTWINLNLVKSKPAWLQFMVKSMHI